MPRSLLSRSVSCAGGKTHATLLGVCHEWSSASIRKRNPLLVAFEKWTSAAQEFVLAFFLCGSRSMTYSFPPANAKAATEMKRMLLPITRILSRSAKRGESRTRLLSQQTCALLEAALRWHKLVTHLEQPPHRPFRNWAQKLAWSSSEPWTLDLKCEDRPLKMQCCPSLHKTEPF